MLSSCEEIVVVEGAAESVEHQFFQFGFGHSLELFRRRHEVVVVVDDLLVERHSADVHFFFEMSVEIGRFLQVDGHFLLSEVRRVDVELAPEGLDVFRLEGENHGLLLENGVVAGAMGEVVDEEDFDERLVAGQFVLRRHQMRNH